MAAFQEGEYVFLYSSDFDGKRQDGKAETNEANLGHRNDFFFNWLLSKELKRWKNEKMKKEIEWIER